MEESCLTGSSRVKVPLLAGKGSFAGGVHGTVGHRLLVPGLPPEPDAHRHLDGGGTGTDRQRQEQQQRDEERPGASAHMLQRNRHIQESTFPAAEAALCVPKRNAKEFVTAKITYSEEKVNLACESFTKMFHIRHILWKKKRRLGRGHKKPPPGGREAAEVRKPQTSKLGSSFSTWMLVMKGLCSGSWNGASLTYLFSATAVRAGSAMVPAPPMQPPGQPMPSSR